MSPEEIIEYNRRCAEFLSYKKDTVNGREVVRIPNKVWSQWSNYVRDYIEDDWYALYEPSFHSLQFHSDWNWIMEIVEAIEKLEFRFEIAYNQIDLECMRPDLDRFSYHINLHDCVGYGNDLHLTKKEAVVKAINQFLIWYNENKTN